MKELFKLLGIVAVNRDEAERNIDSIDRKASTASSSMGASFARVGTFVAGAVVAAGSAIGGTVAAGVMAADSFDKKMKEVFTLMPGITEQAMGAMTEQTKQLAIEMGKMPDEVVPALYEALSAGVPADNVFEFLKTANKAAVGGVTELATAVDGLTSVTNAYGTEVLDVNTASDQMFIAVKLGKTTFQELSDSLFNVVPTAASTGLEFSNVAAAIAAVTAQGTPTSVATTQIRQALVELSKSGTVVSDTFKEITGQSFQDFIAGGGNLGEAMQLLQDHADSTGIGLNDLFGSVEAANAALQLTSETGAKMFNSALEEMQTTSGATDLAFQTMEQNVGASWNKIKAFFNVLLITIGKELLPLLEDWLGWAVERLPEMLETFRSTLDSITGFISTFIGDFKNYLNENESTVSAWQEKLSGFFSSVIESGKEIFATLVDLWQNVLKPAWEDIAPFVGQIFGAALTVIQTVVDGIAIALQIVVDFLQGDFEGAFSGVLDFIENTWSGIVQLFKDFGLDAVAGFLEGFQSTWESARATIEELGHNVIGWFKDVLGIESPSTVFAQIGIDLLQGLINGIVSLVSSVKDTVTNTANSVVGWFKDTFGIESPSTVMYEVSTNLLQGLIDGLGDKTYLDRLREATANVATIINEVFGEKLNPIITEPTPPGFTPPPLESSPDTTPTTPSTGMGTGLPLPGVTPPGAGTITPAYPTGTSPDTTPTELEGLEQGVISLTETFRLLDVNAMVYDEQERLRGIERQNFLGQASTVFGNQLLKLAVDNIPLVGTVLSNLAGGPLAVIGAIFTELIGKSAAFQSIIEKVNKFLEPIIDTLGNLLTALSPIIDVALALVDGALQPLMLILKHVVTPVFSFVAKIIAGIWNAFATAINWALGWLGIKLQTIDLSGGTEQAPEGELTTGQPTEQPTGGMFDEDTSSTLSGSSGISHYVVGVDANVMRDLLEPLLQAELQQVDLLSVLSGDTGQFHDSVMQFDLSVDKQWSSTNLFANTIENLLDRLESIESRLANYDGTLAIS